MKVPNVDVSLIGSASARQALAETHAKKGLRVTIADNRIFGDTYPNRGCDLKKVILSAPEVWNLVPNLKIRVLGATSRLHLKKLQKFKRMFTKSIPVATEYRLNDPVIGLYNQGPEFIDEQIPFVDGMIVKVKKNDIYLPLLVQRHYKQALDGH